MPTVAPAPAPTFPSGNGRSRGRTACGVGGLAVGPDSRISDGQIVDHRGDDDRNLEIGCAPVETDLPLVEKAKDTSGCRQREDAAAGQEERVDALDGTDWLKHHDLRLARGGTVVVDAGSGGRVEEDGRAAGRAAGICEVSDLEPRHVGERSARRGLRLLRLSSTGDGDRPCHRVPELPPRVVRHDRSSSETARSLHPIQKPAEIPGPKPSSFV